jgi:hypothetical protein
VYGKGRVKSIPSWDLVKRLSHALYSSSYDSPSLSPSLSLSLAPYLAAHGELGLAVPAQATLLARALQLVVRQRLEPLRADHAVVRADRLQPAGTTTSRQLAVHSES